MSQAFGGMECPTENGAPIELYFFSVHGDLDVSEAQGRYAAARLRLFVHCASGDAARPR